MRVLFLAASSLCLLLCAGFVVANDQTADLFVEADFFGLPAWAELTAESSEPEAFHSLEDLQDALGLFKPIRTSYYACISMCWEDLDYCRDSSTPIEDCIDEWEDCHNACGSSGGGGTGGGGGSGCGGGPC